MSGGLVGDRVVMAERALVRAIGLAEAVTLQQVQWHIVDCGDAQEHDGERWCPITLDSLADELGLSVDATRRNVRALERAGLLLSCQPEGWSSRRKWYRIDYAAVAAAVAPSGDIAASMRADPPLPKRAISPLPLSKTLEPRPARTRARTARDDYFDVLVEVYGKPTPKRGASFYAQVVTDVMAMPDASPEELRARCVRAVQRYGVKSGPGAVTKNWPMLAETYGAPARSKFDPRPHTGGSP